MRVFESAYSKRLNMFETVRQCSIMFNNVVLCNKKISSLWTKIDYTVNLSWGSEGSKSASTSTGGTAPPSAFTTFINSPEGGDSFR